LTYDQLIGSFTSHEVRLSLPSKVGGVEEKAFATKEGDSNANGQERGQGRGRGGASLKGRGGAQGRGRGGSPKSDKGDKQFYYCNKFGHYERECRLKAS